MKNLYSELAKIVDEVLHYSWDPIGISDTPEARDEYASYSPKVLELLTNGRPANEIADYLISVETEQMGLRGNRAVAERVSFTLLAWQSALRKKLTN